MSSKKWQIILQLEERDSKDRVESYQNILLIMAELSAPLLRRAIKLGYTFNCSESGVREEGSNL